MALAASAVLPALWAGPSVEGQRVLSPGTSERYPSPGPCLGVAQVTPGTAGAFPRRRGNGVRCQGRKGWSLPRKLGKREEQRHSRPRGGREGTGGDARRLASPDLIFPPYRRGTENDRADVAPLDLRALRIKSSRFYFSSTWVEVFFYRLLGQPPLPAASGQPAGQAWGRLGAIRSKHLKNTRFFLLGFPSGKLSSAGGSSERNLDSGRGFRPAAYLT